jgi:hypothetical protein
VTLKLIYYTVILQLHKIPYLMPDEWYRNRDHLVFNSKQLFKFLNWIWNNGCISGLNYNLEKQDEPSVSIDLEATIASMDTMEFCLVRENSE